MKCLSLLLVASSASPALAATFADLAVLDGEVAAFTGAPQGAPGGAALPVDRRLRLAECSGPLALSWYGSRRETVLVECAAPGGWKVYVPLRSVAVGTAAAAAPVVARGDAVTVLVSGAGFAVSQPGEAMEPGALGAWIRVRSAGGKGEPVRAQVLRAQVLRAGVVGIPLP
jgi:flagellar basal body P-ring formation protein FlgA